jgi:hypothetical protein
VPAAAVHFAFSAWAAAVGAGLSRAASQEAPLISSEKVEDSFPFPENAGTILIHAFRVFQKKKCFKQQY